MRYLERLLLFGQHAFITQISIVFVYFLFLFYIFLNSVFQNAIIKFIFIIILRKNPTNALMYRVIEKDGRDFKPL